MIKELIFTGLGATALIKQRVEEEIKTLEKKGKIKKADAKEFLKNLEKKGKLEDKKIKKEIRGHIKELINELGLVTKKDLEKLKKELKEEK
ncbi:hypothetical protein [Halarcobacter anaerophilus]|uniref:Polyhydroxyalkanoate synthesis regulator n=1 Tax=Halarcobacter anaerophilus TaxID=877500 RepID=A0A4Q0XUN4_9BACT|nr:hypothetical protein [Halarcobacter anaerophilus]QDF28829.1 hypothetical protein AANAER_1346 [Halarcobacter anaerophilus]RXJ61260.1 hypothetical protein CRV06_14280 [Halarcobacter anaerophilus]